MLNYYKEKLVKKENQLNIAKCGAIEKTKMLVNASKLLIDKELFGFDEIIEIKTELEKVIEAVEAIQGDIDFCKEQLEKELSKEQERKKLEAHEQKIKEAKELLEKAGMHIIDEVNRNENN